MNVSKISFNTPNRTNFCAKEEKQNPKKEFWAELEKQGIADGDTVSVYDIEFDYVS